MLRNEDGQLVDFVFVDVNDRALAAEPAFDDIKVQIKEEWMAEQISEPREQGGSIKQLPLR